MEKIVRTIDDIIFEQAGITIPKGASFIIEKVTDEGVVMQAGDGERYLIDFVTFEAGFEAVAG